MATLEDARGELRRRFGHPDFRGAQARVIEAALARRDVLAVLPTGMGKSACFQIPALLEDRVTVVVSPLLSLMDDQVSAARSRGLPARAWTSVTPSDERSALFGDLARGELRLLYVSPERLGQHAARRRLAAAGAAAFVVDEAHCVTEWGHDFRPSYLGLAGAHRALGAPRLMALTATATPRTRRQIERLLGLRAPVRILATVDRPNLRWEVRRASGRSDAFLEIERRLRETPGAAIVYAGTRELSARVAISLSRRGYAAAAFHAGLPADRRAWTQRAFLDRRLRVVCATTAFGMGIDHPGVRLVAHLGASYSLEMYVQEAGRAGRDGAPARCVLVSLPPRPYPPDTSEAERIRRDAMRAYEENSDECRRAQIARYFGERAPGCGGCDVCDGISSR